MRVIAIADLHLSLGDGINKSMELFGGAWIGYVDRLRENWEYLVRPEDLVLIPGDISWALHLKDALPDLAWIDALPGKKLLLRGNHDLWWTSMKKMRGLYPSIDFIQNDGWLDPEHGIGIFGSRGWLCPGDSEFRAEEDGRIYRRELIRLQMSLDDLKRRQKEAGLQNIFTICMTHYPPANPKNEESGFMDIIRSAGTDIAVYGHLHSEKAFGNGPQGCIDGTCFRLVSLDRLNAMPLLLCDTEDPQWN
jgi:predicted phosphohydrolase